MDKARFTAAVERYQNMVYRTALHALGSPQDADDAVQEACSGAGTALTERSTCGAGCCG